MISVDSFAKNILYSGELLPKLEKVDIDFDLKSPKHKINLLKKPERSKQIQFSEKQIKFPRGNFHLDERRALALHFFANHELLAIEMMAAALLMFPEENKSFKKNLIETIKDEQKHFKLYINRMKDWGVEFGDFPINAFFWNHFSNIKTTSQFYALVGLTFEQANLDFSLFYKKKFEEVDDHKTADIMNIVLEDEVAHVARGYHWLRKSDDRTKDTWSYFEESLPNLISPARGKGMIFNQKARELAGLSSEFIEKMKNFKDDFNITNRKQWINPTT